MLNYWHLPFIWPLSIQAHCSLRVWFLVSCVCHCNALPLGIESLPHQQPAQGLGKRSFLVLVCWMNKRSQGRKRQCRWPHTEQRWWKWGHEMLRGYGQSELQAWTPQNSGHRDGRVGKREVMWAMANMRPLAVTSLCIWYIHHSSPASHQKHPCLRSPCKMRVLPPAHFVSSFMSTCLWFLSLPTQISWHSQALPRPQPLHHYFGLCPWLWPYLLTM